MSNAIIVTEHLFHTYSSGALQKVALADISIEIKRGSCVAIIGVTGSGKTTLVQHFNGLLTPTSGSVLVDGVNVGGKGVDLRALRQRVGMLFQFPESQLFAKTVFADVAFGLQRMNIGRHEKRARVSAALELVGLPHQAYGFRSPFALSGGQQRRVALAGVLAMSPSVLILDEPTVGLDAEARNEFYTYLQRVQRTRGVTVILVSHDMNEVALLADMLFVLHNGNLVMQGSPRFLFSHGDQLHKWGLAAPPLSELLTRLRKQGMAIPRETFTLDEAFAALKDVWRLPHSH
ncbi:MAG: energy-coupling factor transporter ATPase [Ktedonobacteraceae bacterium]